VIGIGVDVVEIDRVERMMQTYGERVLVKVFTATEVKYCSARAGAARHFAVRLAAKEAAFKALSGSFDARAIGWKELEVENGEHGAPKLLFHGRARARAAELGVERTHLSLTHGRETAVAMVVLEGKRPGKGKGNGKGKGKGKGEEESEGAGEEDD
jgi:holo-[acyl-carrier protein] synthase